MKTVNELKKFVHAVEYVGEHFFSKPYSLSPMVGRWFNQLAVIELENGAVVQLTGSDARDFLDITLDGRLITSKEIDSFFEYTSKPIEIKKKLKELNTEITELNKELADTPEGEATEKKKKAIADKEAQVEALNKDYSALDTTYKDVIALYNQVVERGQVVLNEQRLEDKFQSKIKNIVYKPNHGVTHSVRAAFYVDTLHTFAVENNTSLSNLASDSLDKLHYMMLFSVVGRKDETGFADTAPTHYETYQSYRATSGREYLAYCKKHLKDRYPLELDSAEQGWGAKLFSNITRYLNFSSGTPELDNLYRDAITVELMGYDNIADFFDRNEVNEPPKLFIDYIIERELLVNKKVVSRSEALEMVVQNKYSLSRFFPVGSIRKETDLKLDMMNKAHGLDLMRCYPLYTNKEGTASSRGIITNYINQVGLTKSSDQPVKIESLESAYNMLNYGFKAQQNTGNRILFGVIPKELFDSKKEKIMEDIRAINKQFTSPIPIEKQKEFLDAFAKIKPNFLIYHKLGKDLSDSVLINKYRMWLIHNIVVEAITTKGVREYSKKMFEFEKTQNGDPHKKNHGENARLLVEEMRNLATGMTPIEKSSPVISTVSHDLENKQVTLGFDEPEQATNFVQFYKEHFGITPNIEMSDGKPSLKVDRANYQEMVKMRMLDFKVVTVPTNVGGDNDLVDANGDIAALSLVANSQGLIRLVSTTPLSGEKFPDYDYFLKALENPMEERYVKQAQSIAEQPLNKAQYHDPRTGAEYPRYVDKRDVAKLNKQEPVTAPKKFADKVADGLKVNFNEGAKNTIYTKKMAHSLLPPHGKMIPFPGYTTKRVNYFPIGVISDLNTVDLKDERFVWAQNMITARQFWLRDRSVFEKQLFVLMHAKYDEKGVLQRSSGKIILDLERVPVPSSSEVLIRYLEDKSRNILAKLDERYYFPTEQSLEDLRSIIKQEHQYYADLYKKEPDVLWSMDNLYTEMEERINKEGKRHHSKYALSVKELVDMQKKSNRANFHNELLVGNTKGATRAFTTSVDALFDRLNLAYHAMEIKKKYQYDVPMMVLSATNPPYHYSEALLKADLKQAHKLLSENKFPYDVSLHPGYTEDAQGKVSPILNEQGEHVLIPRNKYYQRALLAKFFQLGTPQMDDTPVITEGHLTGVVNDNDVWSAIQSITKLDEINTNSMIDSIIDKLDLVGGLKRETRLLKDTFASMDKSQRMAFFLRQVSLGHISLVKELFKQSAFVVDFPTYEKAIELAQKNKHSELEELLALDHPQYKELNDNFRKLENLKQEGQEQIAQNIAIVCEQLTAYIALKSKLKVPSVDKVTTRALTSVLLNSASNSVENQKSLLAFAKILSANKEYQQPYAKLVAANVLVNLEELIELHQVLKPTLALSLMELMVDKNFNQIDLLNCLVIFKNRGPEFLSNMLKGIKAMDSNIHTGLIKIYAQEALTLVSEISAKSMGSADIISRNYCDKMRAKIATQDDAKTINELLKELNTVLKAVSSPEMVAVKKQIDRLDTNALQVFGIGNQKKANKIKQAISEMDLLDRARVFTNENNPNCNEVRKELAAHRIAPIDSVGENSKVDVSKAARSFIEVENELKGLTPKNEGDAPESVSDRGLKQ